MPTSDASKTIADSETFGAPETNEAIVNGFHTPAVCINLESLDGSTDDTITIDIVGHASTYTVDEQTHSSTTTYVVDVPQCEKVQVTSTNGSTISAEARNNPR